MVEEFLNLEELLAIKKPEEFILNPPYKAKVLKVEAEVREFDGRKVPQVVITVRRLATQREDGTWNETPATKPFRIYLKVSNRKNSKYAKFIDALWEVAPNLMRQAKSLKDIEGAIFVFEDKEEMFGNIKGQITLPKQYLGKEPITEEEEQMLLQSEVEPENFDQFLQ